MIKLPQVAFVTEIIYMMSSYDAKSIIAFLQDGQVKDDDGI